MPPETAAAAPPPVPVAETLPLRGAELVHLAELLQIRMLRLTAGLLLVGGALTLVLAAVSDGGLGPASAVAAAGGLGLGTFALRDPRTVYAWLRRSPRHPAVLAGFCAAVTLADGVDGPAWWVALTGLLLLSTATSMRFAVVAAFVVAAGYVGGALAAGGSLARHGADAGILAGAIGLPANTFVGRMVCEGFARLVLSIDRPAPQPRQPPLAVDNLAPSPASPRAVVPIAPAPAPAPAQRARALTARQLEVALLARDGLRQPEIAAALDISVTQVERHLRDARKRTGTQTTNELLARLATGRLEAPAP